MSQIIKDTMAVVPSSLKVVGGPGQGLTIVIPSAGLVIGRSGDTPQLEHDAAMSRRHARIQIGEDGLEVTDLHSANGTFCNGQRLTHPARLKEGDVLRLGNSVLAVSLSSPASADAARLLADGRSLLEQGRLGESRHAFSQAMNDPSAAAAGHYGLGMVALAAGELARAEKSFTAALERDAGHSNAAFQLGFLAEQRDDSEAAQAWYRRALAADPAHRGARIRLGENVSSGQGPHPGQTAPTEPAGPPGTGSALGGHGNPSAGSDPGNPGILYFLRQDDAPISQQAVQLIERMEMSVRPNFIAYVGRYASRVAGLVLLAMILAVVISQSGSEFAGIAGPLILLVGALIVVVIIVAFIEVKSTRMRIRQGRLQIERGVLRKQMENIDLWRVLNVNLDRTLVNRLTGDGTLELTVSLDPTMNPGRRLRSEDSTSAIVVVTGIVSGPKLGELHQNLLNLTFLLRGNPVVKGIIQ